MNYIVSVLITGLLAMQLQVAAETHRRENRSREVTRQFQREHPCPSTGKKYGSCPGYIKDHRVALCVGGPDAVSNLQWQTTADAKAKDRWECKK
jgi:Tfp pilus assembly protein PilV